MNKDEDKNWKKLLLLLKLAYASVQGVLGG